MSILVVGFDSAWTAKKSGALVCALLRADGEFEEPAPPRQATFPQASDVVKDLQSSCKPSTAIVMLDQPTIVQNSSGQRPVENIVGSPVSLRYGGVQPANTNKAEMFGPRAPIWPFLSMFGGAVNPLDPDGETQIFETYPVLALIALGWTLPNERPTGRLPKYNPEKRKNFSLSDWSHVCCLASDRLRSLGLPSTATWLHAQSHNQLPAKSDQDKLDACICLLVAAEYARGNYCLMVGAVETGYMVVPDSGQLRDELERRCLATNRQPADWVHRIRRTSPDH